MSLSSRCLQSIDHFGETTGFESRSRVIEEMTFAIADLIGIRKLYAQTFQQPDKKTSTEEAMNALLNLVGVLSRIGGILDRFERFAVTPKQQADSTKKWRYVPIEERNRIIEPKDQKGSSDA